MFILDVLVSLARTDSASKSPIVALDTRAMTQPHLDSLKSIVVSIAMPFGPWERVLAVELDTLGCKWYPFCVVWTRRPR